MPVSRTLPAHAARLGAAGLGAASLVTQVLLLREFLRALGGNELVLGLLLGQWLLLTGLGSLLGARAGQRGGATVTAAAQGAVALLPLGQVLAVRLLKASLAPGLVPALGDAFLWSLLVLAPFCLVSGFLLARLAGAVGAADEAGAVGRVYALDSAGSLAGGVLFAFLLARRLPPVSVASLLLVLNAAAAAATLGAAGRRRTAAAALGALLLGLIGLLRGDLETWSLQRLYPGQELVLSRSTRYGALAVTRQAGQLTVYADGVPVGSTGDRGAAEESVHWALSQMPQPQAVLAICGGLGGALAEIARYRPARVDYAEADPDAVELVRRLDPQALAGVTLRPEDGRRVVETAAPGTWDAILLCLPPPATAQLNRYYTAEFFAAARRALRPGGVLGLALSGAENYARPEARAVAAAVGAALTEAFPEVLVVPGDPLRLVAGDRPLDPRAVEGLPARGIAVQHLRTEYVEARLTPDRLAAARAWIVGAPGQARPNRDLQPAAYPAQLRYGLARSGGGLLWPALFLAGAAILALALVAAHPDRTVAAAVAGSGLAGLGLQVVLLLGFQVVCGYVYHQVALMSAAFLAGAALGAAWSGRADGSPRTRLLGLDAGLAALCLGLAPLLVASHGAPAAAAAPAAFALCAAVGGFLAGAQLPAAARLGAGSSSRRAGRLFGLDLVGSCAGGLGAGLLAVPLLGLPGTCALLGALKAGTALALWRTRALPAAQAVPVETGRPAAAAAAALLALAAIGLPVALDGAGSALYAATFSPWIQALVLGLFGVALAAAAGADLAPGSGPGRLRGWSRRLEAATQVGPLRWLTLAGAGLVVFQPVFGCFFTVPWLFCHACPRPCAFGHLRPYLVPAALLANLERRHWCRAACPLGTLHQCQAALSRRPRRLRRPLTWLAYAALAFTIVGYLEMRGAVAGAPVPGSWHAFFRRDAFAATPAVLAAAALLLLAGFRWLRPFCDLLCPVGNLSELILRLEQWAARRAAAREAGHAL